MENIINKINNVSDLKKLNIEEKKTLADDLRNLILEVVSKNGGHLASNLGVIELTIALHSIFNVAEDKIIWDVGHQVYAHKILTGRKEKINTLRNLGGIAGFPKISESEMDGFDTGHSSTSISVGLGMTRAKDILEKNHKVVSVIGDRLFNRRNGFRRTK
jgi:1-deoxy-D-xylulose-5-phosphate synthase